MEMSKFCQQCTGWSIGSCSFKPTQFLTHSLAFVTNIRFRLYSPMTSEQYLMMGKIANKITYLSVEDSFNRVAKSVEELVDDMPVRVCKKICNLETLNVALVRDQYWTRQETLRLNRQRANVLLLLKQNPNTLQKLGLAYVDTRNLIGLSCNLSVLTTLNLNFAPQTADEAEASWPGFVNLINKSPNLVNLYIKDVAVNDKLLARHPKMKHSNVKSLSLDLNKYFDLDEGYIDVSAYVDLIQVFQHSLQHLTLELESKSDKFWLALWKFHWFLPHVERVDIKNHSEPITRNLVAQHFGENVDIEIFNGETILELILHVT
jgi:hypothetical protein